MSGHSHFRTVMHKKGLADAKRSQMFSKLAKELTVAAKEGGTDLQANPRLRTVIEKAKSANMPADNIERALKKATGEDAGRLEEVLFEAYGPGGVAILVTAITDNKNRTLGQVKQILQKNQGKMVEGGAVRWLFERKGVTTVENAPKDLELFAIEAGAEDLFWRDHTLDIYTDPSALNSLKARLEEKNVHVTASIDWVPKERVNPSEKDAQAAEKLFAALDDQDDVQDMYANI
ncbi:MAG TPA: YebC/PmpR family DNA-binding transcriptional regulator [Candidatus Paceibacterota bacterium]